MEKFGVPPDKVVDVQALGGDSVDNVPGVPGIGVKTAAELINEYGDLDTLLARAAEIKQDKRRETLIEFADQARLSRELVRLENDVAAGVPLDELGVHDPRPEALLGFLRAMEFSTLARRIAEALGAEPPPALEVSVGATVPKKRRQTIAHDQGREDSAGRHRDARRRSALRHARGEACPSTARSTRR